MLKITAKMLQKPWLRSSANNSGQILRRTVCVSHYGDNAKCSAVIFEYAEELQCGKHDQVAIEASPDEYWVFNDCVIAPLLSPNSSMLMVTPEFGIVKTLSNSSTYILTWINFSRVSKSEFEKI